MKTENLDDKPEALHRVASTCSAFEWARHNDATVQNMLAAGRPLEEIVVQLTKEKHELAEKCMKYLLLAPKKLRMPDGSCYVSHCPDELVSE